jgi:PAS domain S-box-containing protein
MGDSASGQSGVEQISRIRPSLPYAPTALIALLVCAGYYVGAELGFTLRTPSTHSSIIWAPNAVLLTVLLLTPPRTWAIWFLAALPAHLLAQSRDGGSVLVLLYPFFANVAQVIVAAIGLRCFAAAPPRFNSLRDTTLFVVVAAIAAPAMISFLTAWLFVSVGWETDFWLVSWGRFLNNLTTGLTVTPLILMAAESGLAGLRRCRAQRYLEFALLAVGLWATLYLTHTWTTVGAARIPFQLYAPLPFLLWAAVRFGPGGLCLFLLFVAAHSISQTISGRGPYVAQTPAENVLTLQISLAVLAMPLMFVAALIGERRKNEEALREIEDRLKRMADSIPEVIWITDLEPEERVVYTSPSFERVWGLRLADLHQNPRLWMETIHPEDRARVGSIFSEWIAGADVSYQDVEFRIVQPNGAIRWIHERGVLTLNEQGRPIRVSCISTDITERKRAEEELQRSEFYLAEGQRLAHSASWSFAPSGICDYWSQELYQILGLDPAKGIPTIADYLTRVHPEDRELVEGIINQMVAEGIGCDFKKRIIRPDGELRVIRCVVTPVRENGVVARFIGTLMDITDQECMTQDLRRKEAYLAEAQRLSQTGSFGWSVSTGEIFWSEETFRIFEYDRAAKPSAELVLQRVHPEDKTIVQHVIDRARGDGKDFDLEHRLLMPDGSIKYLHVVAHGIRDELDQIEFVGAVTDITATKRAEQRIQQDERELRQLIDLVPQHILVVRSDGTLLDANQGTLEYCGMTLQEVQAEDFYTKILHPDDLRRVLDERQGGISAGSSWETEARLLRKDGQYRWFLIRSNPLRNEQGSIIRRYITATDIESWKQAEERVERENIALREEVDKASMFEEIVGSSNALQKVLLQIAKVAPTDSTVLITGETGTGKELIARAIHKRSRRSSRAFVSINCSAIPQPLIASELFGHEKGAFTGALQQRLGRFELAEGGTIFLDEIGDFPSDTQNTLLRVLQEHEFERVGGTQTIRADVRVIAATNRDLMSAIAGGTFRRDLFYRLNVFPIETPSLRERKEDIPMLVEYFIDRYASKMGKDIKSINKKSLELLQRYSWSGNIRELQNVIERSVVVCETETLVIDENWLPRHAVKTPPLSRPLFEELQAQEKERIEAALTESRGRVSGASGAAAKLGIPPSTLDSKIRSLKINGHRFKTI